MSYLEERIYKELGVRQTDNIIRIKKPDNPDYFIDAPVFSSDNDDNIDILIYNLDREITQYNPPEGDPSQPGRHNEILKTAVCKRLKAPKNGIKYIMPKGMASLPFFPPHLINKFEKKKKIKNLFLTEGFIKSFKGAMHGLDIIGISGIHNYKEKKTQRIYFDISRIITECKVENVVVIYDGDCAEISSKNLNDNEDLRTRPLSFYTSIKNISELLIDYNVNLWFTHIISTCHNSRPKGVDDLLIAFKGTEKNITDSIQKLSEPSPYIYKLRIISNREIRKISNLLHLSSVEDFYSAHEEKISDREFIFSGTRFKFLLDEQGLNGKLTVVRKKEADDYFRVGDNYYEKIMVPNKHGTLEQRYDLRKKSTITDDNGKEIIKDIPKYKAFCNVPDHINYQSVIDNCYNIYYSFTHSPEHGSVDSTMMYLKHIFGEQLEIGLDYLQLLYKEPKQILPILCLVSKENMTGKTLFLTWLKAIFEQNMTIVGNAELAEQFNSSYATKLIIGCDETFIDRDLVMNKIKSMSTGNKINLRAMQRDYVEIDFFGKFILLSNYENNFVKANEFDVRYWIRKVPVITKENVDVKLIDKLLDEIPAFLYYLDNRKLVHANSTRMYFDNEILETEALQKVREHSRSSVAKEITTKIKEMFFLYREFRFRMSITNIKDLFLKGKMNLEHNYIKEVLSEQLRVPLCNKGTVRYKIPRFNTVNEVVHDEYVGRPYEFLAEQFLSEAEFAELNEEIKNNPVPDLIDDYKQNTIF